MKTPFRSFEVELLKEIQELDFFVVKAPVNSKEFWKEWQEKYSKANMTRIAIRHILQRRLPKEDYLRAKGLLQKYEEVVEYLENLKNVALSRGYGGNYYIEFGEEDEEEEGGV